MDDRMDVLDYGFVELIDSLGSDLTVVNSARVSFGKRVETLSKRDEGLIRFLAENKHWRSFRHVQIQFYFKVPEFVARQWYKHVGVIAYTEQASVDHAWNEISLRYIDASEIDFYTPDGFRRQASDNKQASTDESVEDPKGELRDQYVAHSRQALALYHHRTECGVARAQARAVLPLNNNTEF